MTALPPAASLNGQVTTTAPAKPPPAPLPEPVDWPTLFAGDVEHHWLVEDFWPEGRQLHIFAAAKEGKSEVMLWVSACIATGRHPFSGESQPPRNVTYLDFEQTEDDVRERLEHMGFDASELAAHFRYYLFPSIAAMDTAEGGDRVLAIAQRDEADAVVIDTLSRVTAGEENSNDTFQSFYQHTGLKLKAAGISMARLDHEGHTSGRSRGGSAKVDDVDVVWRVVKQDGGTKLERNQSRLGWVPDLIELRRSEDPLAYKQTSQLWPAGTEAKAKELDALGLPLDVTKRAAKEAFRRANQTAGRDALLGKAIKWRKQQAAMVI